MLYSFKKVPVRLIFIIGPVLFVIAGLFLYADQEFRGIYFFSPSFKLGIALRSRPCRTPFW